MVWVYKPKIHNKDNQTRLLFGKTVNERYIILCLIFHQIIVSFIGMPNHLIN